MISSAASQKFFAFNPSTFDDPELWTQRDLQRLCSKLGLRATGSRADLVHRLQVWHRSSHSDPECAWPAGKFTMLGVSVYQAPAAPASPAPASPAPLSPKRQLAVSPRFLSPLMGRKKTRPRTPSSILRQGEAPSSAKRVMFSPYNGIHLIPHREDGSSRDSCI